MGFNSSGIGVGVRNLFPGLYKMRREFNWMEIGLFLLSFMIVAMVFADERTELIGTEAKEWKVIEWINSKPLTVPGLRGKVVLVRWWTGPDCPFCASSAPYLNDWYQKYHKKGLAVIGFYHHKSAVPLSVGRVRRLAEQFEFEFPIAIDPEWQTLKRWWLNDPSRQWTSVSFLIDPEGMIRYIHPGGSYTQEEAQTIEAMIQELLFFRNHIQGI